MMNLAIPYLSQHNEEIWNINLSGICQLINRLIMRANIVSNLASFAQN